MRSRQEFAAFGVALLVFGAAALVDGFDFSRRSVTAAAMAWWLAWNSSDLG